MFEHLASQSRERRLPLARLQMMRPRPMVGALPRPSSPPQDAFPVYVVERSRSLRVALTRDLRSAGFEVRPFESIADFVGSTEELEPGCLVVDASQLASPPCPGAGDPPNGVAGYPTILTFESLSHEDAVMAVRLGAADLVNRPVSVDELAAALSGAAGRVREQRARLQSVRARAAVDSLSPREFEVMDGLMRGASSKEIARALGLSHRTVEMHRSRLHRKLKVGSIAGLLEIGWRASVTEGFPPGQG